MARMNMVQALNSAMDVMLGRDPRVVILGEDVGYFGGVFRVTDGLQKDFGEARVIDTPLAESGIIGTAIGLALRGYRPICEIQFDGFVYPATDQIVSQLAKMRYRSRGHVALPVVIRIPFGGGIGAGLALPCASASSIASTNADALAKRSSCCLAMPRASTASSAGGSAALRTLARGGGSSTCDASTSKR